MPKGKPEWKALDKTEQKIEECINEIALLEKKFGRNTVYKASRRYYDRAYAQYDFVE